jgi:peptide/nickel transport system permease protein
MSDLVKEPVAAPVTLASTPRTPFSWVRLRGRAPLIVGLVLVILIVISAVFAPLLAPYDPNQQDLANALVPPFTAGHPLGTDQFGRDLLSRVLYAGRVDLLIAFAATCVTLTFGSLYGLVSGFAGRRVDAVMMRIVDIVFAFPLIVLVLAIIAILGGGLLNMLIAMWAVTWVAYARIVRGEVLVLKQRDYTTAARALGYGNWRIMFRHVLPNAAAPALVFAMVDAVNNVSIGAALGFLGLGVSDPTPEWGKMIADAQEYISTNWWLAAVPGVMIALFGVGLSLIGDNLADWLRGER